MLLELANVTQPPGEPPRRWFHSDTLDLIVWCDELGAAVGFQLCYHRDASPFAITWWPGRGFSHNSIDEGDRIGGRHKAIPILVPASDVFPARRVIEQFVLESAEVPLAFRDYVLGLLSQHPDYGRAAGGICV